MVIRLTVPNKTDEAVWLQEIQRFVKALREQKYLSA